MPSKTPERLPLRSSDAASRSSPVKPRSRSTASSRRPSATSTATAPGPSSAANSGTSCIAPARQVRWPSSSRCSSPAPTASRCFWTSASICPARSTGMATAASTFSSVPRTATSRSCAMSAPDPTAGPPSRRSAASRRPNRSSMPVCCHAPPRSTSPATACPTLSSATAPANSCSTRTAAPATPRRSGGKS